jgi:hypothetical protein
MPSISKAIDPTYPKVPISIGGKKYFLCFDLEALAQAEAALVAEGHREVNLLVAFPNQNLSNTRMIFAAALRVHQPKIPFEKAKRLLGMADTYSVAVMIQKAWQESLAEPEPDADPEQPAG